MSNKLKLSEISTSEAQRVGVTSLADRPTGASRYGDGGLSAQKLKERFDALPNFVSEKFNAIARMLADTDAAKYITIGAEDNALGETLYDFLLLFGSRGDGAQDKNISDYIETLYQGEEEDEAAWHTLREIVQSIISRFAAVETGKGARLALEVSSSGEITLELLNAAGEVLDKCTAGGQLKVSGIADGAVTNAKLSEKSVSFEKLGDDVSGRITGLENGDFTRADYNAKNGKLTFFAKDGSEKATVNLPLDLVVTNGRFDTASKDIVLVLSNGKSIYIPLDDFVDTAIAELKRIDAKLPTPTGSDEGRFLKASGGKIVFSDIGDYQFPKMRAPLSVTVDNRAMSVTFANQDSPFVLSNRVYIGDEEVATVEAGTSYSFADLVGDRKSFSVYVTTVSEGFRESDKVERFWGLTNGTAGLAYSGNCCTGIGTAMNMSSIEIATYNNGINIRAIGEIAFSNITTINSITIPESITEIVNYAFQGCTNLHYVYYTGTLEGWCNIRLGSDASNPMYYAAYLYIGGSRLKNLIIPDTVTDIKNRFRGCHSLLSAEIPKSVTVIGSAAFANCKYLADVKISDGVESIDTYAFWDCKSLTSITIPKSVTQIDKAAFRGCTNLKTVTFNGTPTGITYSVFANCASLTDIYVPWSEGEVANAPWGATNATIHYNSEG